MKQVLIALACTAIAFGAQAAETEKKEAASPVSAKYDTKLPVEISADHLEVLQKENKAIFKGNVIAVQGKLRMNADEMTVHYRQKDDAAKSESKEPKLAAAQDEMGAVERIEVEGHVLVVTPEESAQGDRGDYEVDKKILRLTGDNVILTREQNILRGKSVEYDMVSGRSVLTNGPADGKTADGKKVDNRVRGVFVPKSQPKAEKK